MDILCLWLITSARDILLVILPKIFLAIGMKNPLLGRIDLIYVQPMKIRFLVKVCTIEFNPHLVAYIVDISNYVDIVDVTQLYNHCPLSAYSRNSRKYVVAKNLLFDDQLYTLY